MAYFDTPDPWRIKLVKTGPLQYRIETVIQTPPITLINTGIDVEKWYMFKIISENAQFNTMYQDLDIFSNSGPQATGAAVPVINPGQTLYFGSLNNNLIDPGVIRTVDGLMQGLFMQQDKCDFTLFNRQANSIIAPMKMLAYYPTLDYFTVTYPNILKGVGMLPDLQNGSSLVNDPEKFPISVPEGASIAQIGDIKYATTQPFTPAFDPGIVYKFITVTQEVRWIASSGTVSDWDVLFTVNTHIKIRIIVEHTVPIKVRYLTSTDVVSGPTFNNGFVPPNMKISCSIGLPNPLYPDNNHVLIVCTDLNQPDDTRLSSPFRKLRFFKSLNLTVFSQ